VVANENARTHGRYPVWLLLLLVVFCPLLALGFLASERQEERTAASIAANELRSDLTLGTELSLLGYWLSVSQTTERINAQVATPDGTATGLADLFATPTMLSFPRAKIESSLTRLNLADANTTLAKRLGPDRDELRVVLAGYGDMIRRIDAGLASSSDVSAYFASTGDVVDAVGEDRMNRALDASSSGSHSVRRELTALNSVLRGHRAVVTELSIWAEMGSGGLLSSPPNARQVALAAHTIADYETTNLLSIASDETRTVWIDFLEQPENARLEELRLLAPAAIDLDAADAASLGFDSVEYVSLSFERVIAVADDLVPAQFQRILLGADELTADSSSDATKSAQLVVTVAGVTALLLLVIGEMLLRPLRQLQHRATELTLGREDLTPLGPIGPREVAVVAIAMDDVSSNLQLIEQQLEAISAQNFDAEVLTTRLPGAVGRSLEQSIQSASRSSAVLHGQARVDALTGLPNRLDTVERLDITLADRAEGEKIAIAFLDLDGFKSINDGFGHDAGDHLLIAVADRLRAAQQPGEFIGRIGGDEFLAIGRPIVTVGDAIDLAERLLTAIEEPFSVAGREIEVTMSAGVAVAEPGPKSGSQLLHEADLGLYASKSRAQRITVCTAELTERAAQLREITEAFEAALGTPDLQLHLQPIVSLETGKTVAAEALLRWTRDGRPVPPDEFIPVIESTRLISELGRWVIAEAAMLAGEIIARTGIIVPISVNISWNHIASGDLIHDVWSALDAANIPGSCLRLEFTESTPPPNIDRAADVLGELSKIGVGLWLDDFGTGYTSITQLRQLEFDAVKLDRSFVVQEVGPDEIGLAEALVDIISVLGVEVIAEGVEQHAEGARMVSAGATSGQGWLWSRDLGIDEFIAYIELESNEEVPPRAVAHDVAPTNGALALRWMF